MNPRVYIQMDLFYPYYESVRKRHLEIPRKLLRMKPPPTRTCSQNVFYALASYHDRDARQYFATVGWAGGSRSEGAAFSSSTAIRARRECVAVISGG